MQALLSLSMLGINSERGEEAYWSCGCRIPSDWLQVTVYEIKEQLRRDELEHLVCTILVTKEDPSD